MKIKFCARLNSRNEMFGNFDRKGDSFSKLVFSIEKQRAILQ